LSEFEAFGGKSEWQSGVEKYAHEKHLERRKRKLYFCIRDLKEEIISALRCYWRFCSFSSISTEQVSFQELFESFDIDFEKESDYQMLLSLISLLNHSEWP
jgi:hypothetical protein